MRPIERWVWRLWRRLTLAWHRAYLMERQRAAQDALAAKAYYMHGKG